MIESKTYACIALLVEAVAGLESIGPRGGGGGGAGVGGALLLQLLLGGVGCTVV